MGKKNKTRDVIEAVTGLVKAVPIYKDAVQPAAKEIGVGLQKTVHMALAPISALVWGYDKIEDFVKTSVAERLKRIPHDQIITPLPQIAGPALEALKYTGHDKNLREMFAKLLATAMDEKIATEAHPSFVEIIRQLSSDEAKICRILKVRNIIPVVNLNARRPFPDGSFKTELMHFSTLGYEADCKFPKQIQGYLDNLKRLGLIHIDFTKEPTDEAFDFLYTALEENTDLRPYIKAIKDRGALAGFQRGVIERNIFGFHFLNPCVD